MIIATGQKKGGTHAILLLWTSAADGKHCTLQRLETSMTHAHGSGVSLNVATFELFDFPKRRTNTTADTTNRISLAPGKLYLVEPRQLQPQTLIWRTGTLNKDMQHTVLRVCADLATGVSYASNEEALL